MRKLLCFLTGVSFFMNLALIIPSALAASGACSNHGGVDCTAGPDSDGSVICNDGWLNSSVSYASMVMCRNYATQPPIQPTVVAPAPITPVVDAASNPSIFSDVNDSTPFQSSILLLKEKNIISGYPDGTYQPFKTLNRAELLKIVVTAKYPVIAESYNQNCFNDIQKDQWYTKPVCFAKAQGFIQGYSNNTFRPVQEVNYVEALKIALETFDLKPADQTSIWYEAYIQKAKSLEIDIEGSAPSESLSRAKAAEMIARSLANL